VPLPTLSPILGIRIHRRTRASGAARGMAAAKVARDDDDDDAE
jgi:hypothetical protein